MDLQASLCGGEVTGDQLGTGGLPGHTLTSQCDFDLLPHQPWSRKDEW